jgi:hypothetical protein
MVRAAGVELGQGAVGLDGRVGGALEEVLALDERVGARERRVDVAEVQPDVFGEVAALAA